MIVAKPKKRKDQKRIKDAETQIFTEENIVEKMDDFNIHNNDYIRCKRIKDILKKVEALEKEEEEILKNGDKGLDLEDNDNMDDGEESSELSDDLIEAHEKLMKDLKTIKERHKLVKRSKLPSRLTGESATDKFMAEIRPDLKEKADKIKLISHKMRREQKDKVRNNLKKDAGIEDNDDMDDIDEMDIDEENQKTVKKKKTIIKIRSKGQK